jgi:uncharacterized protein (TIGR00266 family)
MQYQIEGGNLPVVICTLREGETLRTQSGAMSWMSENMEMLTHTGGGIQKVFGRMFSGESVFLNDFTPIGGEGMIAMASSFPGSIMACSVTPGNGIIVQKNGFLAMESGLELSLFFQRKLGSALFGGEGFIMEKVSGTGTVFIEIDGYCKEYELGPQESILVDTGYLAAMSESCRMEVVTVKGWKNKLFGGDGFFHTRIMGPGKVYLQSMPVMQTAKALSPYLQIKQDQDDNKSIKIRLGD